MSGGACLMRSGAPDPLLLRFVCTFALRKRPVPLGTGYQVLGTQSLHAHQLHIEDERRIRRDHARVALRAIGEVRRNPQLALAPNLHPRHAFLPALDYVPRPDLELERLTADRAIKLLPVRQPARVVHEHGLPVLRGRAGALADVPVLQAGGSLGPLTGHFRGTRCCRRGFFRAALPVRDGRRQHRDSNCENSSRHERSSSENLTTRDTEDHGGISTQFTMPTMHGTICANRFWTNPEYSVFLSEPLCPLW